jgi:hypothetical protein
MRLPVRIAALGGGGVIARVRVSQRSLAVGAVAGLLSSAACFLPGGQGSQWAPGLIFGVLVLAPSYSGAARRALLVIASALVYRAAVWLASTLYVNFSTWEGGPHIPSCTLAGGLGALALAVLVSLITSAPLDRRATRRSVVVGAVAGAFLDGYFALADQQRLVEYAAVAACFVLWQASYPALHHLAPWRALELHPADGT